MKNQSSFTGHDSGPVSNHHAASKESEAIAAKARRVKLGWLVLGPCLFVIVGFVAFGAYQVVHAVHNFAVEDGIHDAFFPVARALYTYQDEHSHPAASLQVLVPKYLDAVPSTKLADKVEYRVSADDQWWELSIHSRALSRPRVYLCRSTQQFTPEEKHRILLRYHAVWAVFPAEQ